MPSTTTDPTGARPIATDELKSNPFSLSIYGDPAGEIDDLVESIRAHGILVPLVVAPEKSGWEVLSGHRRLACAERLGLRDVPCVVRTLRSRVARQRAILEYNCQRRKTFSQLMREADALESWLVAAARRRRAANLRQFRPEPPDRRNSDDRSGRTDATLARALGLGGKDLYRQARAIWRTAQTGDPRACSSLAQLDAGTKTIHAAYKDLRRRDRFAAGFRPTPYDVWSFKHDRAFGIPHPGSIPPAIVAHLLHYYTTSESLVVDPMAGGGTTLDVCTSMGRRCLAYDLHPVRPEILAHDVNNGFPPEVSRMRPGLLRSPLPYDVGATVRRRGRRDGAPCRVARLPRSACPARLRHPPLRRVRRPPARQPDRERPPSRVWLPRSRLFWLYAP